MQSGVAGACTLCEQSVALFQLADDTEGIVYCLQGFGVTAARQGKFI